jgi:hypothetical protein
MKQAISGLIVFVLFVGGVWAAFQVFGDNNVLNRSHSKTPVVDVPRRLPGMEKARMEVELSLVEADFEARKVAKSRLPQNRNIKIDR